MATATSRLLREVEAATYLDLAPGTLRNWRSQGIGPRFVRLRSAIRYDLRELDRWIAESTRSGTR